ncbi:MAG TPA: prepilin peptidase [Microbacteriaceae bacterium]|nr:prepilin peptidase [Microbacteriaceae bacterium]
MGWVNIMSVVIGIGFAIPLVWFDVREHRLPNSATFGLFLSELALLTVATALTGEWPKLAGALLGALAMAAIYGVLALPPGGMGLGDVKLALGIGLVAAWWSWSAWALALAAAFLCGSLWSVIRAARERSWRFHVAFGPAMLLGWGIASIAGLA